MKTFNNFIKEVKLVSEKNKPTSPDKWARAKSAAKSKFAVYPSAYANAWASKKYKSMGGDWKAEELEIVSNIAESIDKKDTITFDIPLLIRVFELVREDIKTDADLHRVVECLINIRNKGVLTMDNYDEIAHLNESVDSGEYDYEGDMAKVQLQTLCRNSKDLIDMLDDNENMPEWVQSKITLAQDYITRVRDYLQSKQELGESLEETAAWQKKAGKNPEGGLNRKGIASYRRENPGSKLSMAVTTKPSKLDPDSKAAKRRKSFCARMGGMKKRLTSKETARDPDSRINKALRKWNC